MKLRTLGLLAVGFAAGVAFARRMGEDDPDVVHGPLDERRAQSPTRRLVSGGAERLAGAATTASLAAIRRARGAIRERLGEAGDDGFAAGSWN